MPPAKPSNNNELVVKREAWFYLIYGLPMLAIAAILVFFGDDSAFFTKNLTATIIVLLVFIAAGFFLVRYSMDSRIKLLINSEGIWTPKHGLLGWSNIQHYFFEKIVTDDGTIFLMKIQLMGYPKEVEIDISLFNTNVQAIFYRLP
jgi:hypothetical protein